MFTYSCIRKAREQFLKRTFYTTVLVNVTNINASDHLKKRY